MADGSGSRAVEALLKAKADEARRVLGEARTKLAKTRDGDMAEALEEYGLELVVRSAQVRVYDAALEDACDGYSAERIRANSAQRLVELALHFNRANPMQQMLAEADANAEAQLVRDLAGVAS